ncbi:DUF2520 domain-containing protein [Candidatus Woesearchaeota archaeon]|nr:DUF2520 domain-containing protein [Candidatus Woesearchaeota archaeon]
MNISNGVKSVAIIGAGKVGQTIGRILHRSGRYRIKAVWSRRKSGQAVRFIGRGVMISRTPEDAARYGQIVLITTPDDAIKSTYERLARANAFQDKTTVIHCSGNFSHQIFKHINRSKNISLGSLHPLQTFTGPRRTLKGIYCVYEGEPDALREIKLIISVLGGRPIRINPANKPLYHCAGVIVSNYLVTLINIGRQFLKAAGFKDNESIKALQPLINATFDNIKAVGVPKSLTGPVARGDISTIRNHLAIIRKKLPSHLHFYRIFGNYTVDIARAKRSINNSQAVQLRKLFGGKDTK